VEEIPGGHFLALSNDGLQPFFAMMGGSRTLRCLDYEGPDPIKSPYATGWLAGEP
jgi:hypothetical protein